LTLGKRINRGIIDGMLILTMDEDSARQLEPLTQKAGMDFNLITAMSKLIEFAGPLIARGKGLVAPFCRILLRSN